MIDQAEFSDARYERKFLVSGMSAAQVEHVVRMNTGLFRSIYQPRWVNNVYLDSINLDAFSDTIEGVRDRVKIRIRWYGDAAGKIERPVLELKRKRGFVTVKDAFPLSEWDRGSHFSPRSLRSLLDEVRLPAQTRELLKFTRPTLFNRYMRSYSISHCGTYRITIDRDQDFQRMSAGLQAGLTTGVSDLVLEIKYGVDADRGVQSITQHLPFRMTKSSKYATGILLTAP